MRPLVLALVLLTFAAPSALAQWTTDGVPLCGERGYQYYPQIAADGSGGLLSAWVDARVDTQLQVFARRLTADGVSAPGWPDSGVRVTAYPPPVVGIARVVADGDGGMFVACIEGDSIFPPFRVRVRHLLGNSTHDPTWPDTGVVPIPARTNSPTFEMIGDGAGGMLVVAQGSYDGGANYSLWAQRLTATGALAAGWPATGVEIILGGSVQIVGDGSGGVILGYYRSSQFRAQHVPGNGAPPDWNPPDGVLLKNSVSGSPQMMDAETDGSGGAYFMISDLGQFVQRVSAIGTIPTGWALGGRGLVANGTFDFEQWGSLADDGAGGMFGVMFAGNFGDPEGVVVQRIDSDGTDGDAWPPGGVYVAGTAGYPHIARRAGGGVFVARAQYPEPSSFDTDMYVSLLTDDGGIPLGWSPTGVVVSAAEHDQYSPLMVGDASGNALIAWLDDRGFQTPNYTDVYAAKVLGTGAVNVAVSLASAAADVDRVRLTWRAVGISSALLERREGDEDWRGIAALSADGAGWLEYEDRDVVAGAHYEYRLRYVAEGGGVAYGGFVAIEVPVASRFGLVGARPNPALGAIQLEFALERAGEVRIELVDMAGRVVLTHAAAFDGGRHVLPLPNSAALAPGVYVARLTHLGRIATQRVVVTR